MKINKGTQRLLFLCSILFALGCRKESSKVEDLSAYEQGQKAFLSVLEKESRREEQFDSLFYGIHFKMTIGAFHEHCNKMHKKGIFDGNNTYEVVIGLEDGFKKPVNMVFSPTFDEPFIKLLKVHFYYTNVSVFDKDSASDVLIEEVIEKMMKWYDGSDFIKVPPKYPYERPFYIKVDGNRKITIKESDSYREVIALYEDLKPLY